MDTNIEITNINKHFRLFDSKKHSKKIINRKKNTKLIDYDFYSINESKISEKIKKIPYYSNYFIIVEDYDFVNIGQLNDTFIEKLESTTEKKYLLFTYKNDVLVSFDDFLFALFEPRLFVHNIIESFSYLLNSLIQLNDSGICFFNLSPQNIVFNKSCGEKPQLMDFHLSLIISTLNEEYISKIIKKHNDYTHKPLEVHVLFYLIQNNMPTISYSFIEEICGVFTKNLTVLELFSEKYRESYKATAIESLKKYVNKSKRDVILDILSKYDTWDVYSLSVLYLYIFGHVSKFFSLKTTFINKIALELSKNIHPDPAKRNSLKKLLDNYNNLLLSEKNWDFVTKMEREMMPQLFNTLGL
jgi:hypothetical protein